LGPGRADERLDRILAFDPSFPPSAPFELAAISRYAGTSHAMAASLASDLPDREVLDGIVEWITFHNADVGLRVLGG
jgi:hypothetical protein